MRRNATTATRRRPRSGARTTRKTICNACGLYYKLDGSAHPISKSGIIRERLLHDARRGEASASVSETPTASPDVSCRMYPGHGPASSASPRPTELHPPSRGRRRTCARVHAVGKSAGTPPAVLHCQRIVAALGWLAVLLGLIIVLLSPGFAMAFSPYLVIQRDGDAPSFVPHRSYVAEMMAGGETSPLFGLLSAHTSPAAARAADVSHCLADLWLHAVSTIALLPPSIPTIPTSAHGPKPDRDPPRDQAFGLAHDSSATLQLQGHYPLAPALTYLVSSTMVLQWYSDGVGSYAGCGARARSRLSQG
ncbi:hypothetical protein DFH08DRAFT_969417 [Mycena albidolilacea]|uniref:GATA-type domain-containing protein n=1 Tax=Mycena albidolilacea TaxID=1033008 RepID=A0AAD6ZIA3_9AGAR|nr:hypothetical protein DFH08DRAFT_969417 [Mycena albidolilacea]